MLKSLLVSVGLVAVALAGGCTTEAPAVGGTGGVLVATGGTITGSDPACGNDGVTVGVNGCGEGLSCQDVSGGLIAGLTFCSCPATSLPPVCDPAVASSCAAYPGTACMTLATFGSYCAKPCTFPAATGGVVAETGGDVVATGGAVAASSCFDEPAASDGSTCMAGLTCKALIAGTPATCNCPKTNMPPPCTEGGDECLAFTNTLCSDLPAGGKGCLATCTDPNAAPVGCPGELTCADLVGTGPACMSGAFPPPCTNGAADCEAYPGTICVPLPILGDACYMSCTL